MKSEHRHELAENDLSKVLAKWGAEFDKHANTILSVLIVIALLAAGFIFWTRSSAATNALGWTDLANASSPEDFQNVAETYAGTPVAEWATLRAADGLLREGIRLSLSDRPASDERLEQAKASFQALLEQHACPERDSRTGTDRQCRHARVALGRRHQRRDCRLRTGGHRVSQNTIQEVCRGSHCGTQNRRCAGLLCLVPSPQSQTGRATGTAGFTEIHRTW